jgi:hypothetical protein
VQSAECRVQNREPGNRSPETGIELQTANRAAFATCGLKVQAEGLTQCATGNMVDTLDRAHG